MLRDPAESDRPWFQSVQRSHIQTKSWKIRGFLFSLLRTGHIFEKVALAEYSLEMSGGERNALGVELHGWFSRTSGARERYWRLYGALSFLLMRRKTRGEMLEVSVGHCTYAALVRRPVLCVFH